MQVWRGKLISALADERTRRYWHNFIYFLFCPRDKSTLDIYQRTCVIFTFLAISNPFEKRKRIFVKLCYIKTYYIQLYKHHVVGFIYTPNKYQLFSFSVNIQMFFFLPKGQLYKVCTRKFLV